MAVVQKCMPPDYHFDASPAAVVIES
jgi:hypothetical protein